MSDSSAKKPLYGNCRVENIDGVHIFNTSLKKCNWYLKRNLAIIVQEEPFVIRLTFKTKDNGRANDPFYLQERPNLCVCCGTTSSLTRHHVVPIMYRRHFPDDLKMFSSHDVLPMCLPCHNQYEIHADQLKRELLEELNISQGYTCDINKDLKRVVMAASALSNNMDSIPPERCVELSKVICEYYKTDTLTQELLDTASKIEYITINGELDGKQVVSKIGSIEEFMMRWRVHFLEYAKPQYMPSYWDIGRVDRARLNNE